MNWSTCRLAVFDVDGTLYEPRPMRIQMARRVAWAALAGGDIRLPLVIRALRRTREQLAEDETEDFEATIFRAVGDQFGLTEDALRSLHAHWFDEVPLATLKRYVIPGAASLFSALRRAGITVAVLSDHRADRKIAALGLEADMIVSAADVGVQKPNPRGLQSIIDRTGFRAEQTVMIGDRADRDGAIAARAGTGFLLRGRSAGAHFQRYDDPVFHPVLKT